MVDIDISILKKPRFAIPVAYLLLVAIKDYPSNMSKIFQESIDSKIWNPKSELKIKSLTKRTLIKKILKNLHQLNILKSKIIRVKNIKIKQYSVNFDIFINKTIIENDPYLKNILEQFSRYGYNPKFDSEWLKKKILKYLSDNGNLLKENWFKILNLYKDYNFITILHNILQVLSQSGIYS